MNDILPILALVSVAGIGLLQMFKPSPAAYSNSTTGGGRRTRKNLKK